MLYAWAVICLGVFPMLVGAIYLMDSWWYHRNKPGR